MEWLLLVQFMLDPNDKLFWVLPSEMNGGLGGGGSSVCRGSLHRCYVGHTQMNQHRQWLGVPVRPSVLISVSTCQKHII